MKGGSVNVLRGRQLPLTLMAFVCTTILIFIWEKTPGVPSSSRLEMLSPELLSSKAPFINSETHTSVAEGEEEEITVKEKLESSSPWDITSAVSEKPKDRNSNNSSTAAREELLTQSRKINEACNYGKGKWVPDKSRPLYSGFTCKQWLSAMWACRLTQRLDFTYESYRWQPDSCDMPNFDGSKFLTRMKHKTIAMVGDSLGRQQFQSLMCMVTGGEERPDVEDVGWEYGLVVPPGGKRPDGWAYRFPATNTTILYYWSASLCAVEPLNASDPNTEYAMHLDRPAQFLSHYLDSFDVLVLNTGHHWNRGKLRANRWIMYVDGKPNTRRNLADMGSAKNLTVHSVVKWLDLQLPHHPRLKAFFRTLSPRHFFNGDWNTGGSCDNTIPLAGGNQVVEERSSDVVAESAVRGTRVKLLDITGLSSLRDEGHISRYSIKATEGVQDCLHWCLPGIPDTWNEILFAQL
ncbi:trichome birefringence-like 16 protein [Nymphaea thermarum]|nr:trichome birefringence-like 16 protein [Nymphaea thermarum]